MIFIWAFAIGLLHVPLYSAIPDAYWFLLLVLPAFIQCGRFISSFSGPFAAFALGAALGVARLQAVIDHQLPIELDASTVTMTYEIVSLVEQKSKSQAFTVKIHSVDCASSACVDFSGRRMRLSWFKASPQLKTGQVLKSEVHLKRPRGLVNPGGFDYQAWLLGQDFFATGYVKGLPQFQDEMEGWPSIRAGIQQKVKHLSSENTSARFWPALILADRSAIVSDDWQTLQNTGTVHLMAISGLHIGLVALLLHCVGHLLARLFAAVFAFRNSGVVFFRFIPPLLSCSGALFYAALAGFSIPTLRAFCACVAVQCFRLLGWKIPHFTLLGIGLAVVGLSEPLAIESSGFWLSFLAVASLVVLISLYPAPRGIKGGVRHWARIQVGLTLLLSLPLVCLGQVVSLSAPLANLVAIPVVSFVVVPLLMLATITAYIADSASQLLFGLADWVFSCLWWVLNRLANWHHSTWWPGTVISGGKGVLAGLALTLILTPRAIYFRGLGILLLVALLVPCAKKEEVKFTVMDVGQGTAAVLQAGGKTLVYDTGPRFSDDFDAGGRILLPYLRGQGVQSIDLVVSHNDLDHSGGAASLLGGVNVTSLYFGEYLNAANATQSGFCSQGQQWEMGGVTITVLWPPAGHQYRGNRASCVLLAEFDEAGGKPVSLLLTGDVDTFVEDQLINAGLPKGVDLLLAPHHGSRTSSGYGFVRHVSPKYVVYSAGFKSRYGHPNAKVRQRYQREQSTELNTAESGAVTFIWGEIGMRLDEARKTHKRAWFW